MLARGEPSVVGGMDGMDGVFFQGHRPYVRNAPAEQNLPGCLCLVTLRKHYYSATQTALLSV